MSKNYIKVLLKPFRESKVLGSLLKWFEGGAGESTGGAKVGIREVEFDFLCFFYCYMAWRLCDGFLWFSVGPGDKSWYSAVQLGCTASHAHPGTWDRSRDHCGRAKNIRGRESSY